MKEESLERRRAGLDFVEPVTFAEYADLFHANHFREKSESYRRSSFYWIQGSFVPILGSKLVHEIDQADIVALRNELRTKNLSSKSLRNCLGLLHTMFKKAIDNGFSYSNPVEGVERPRNIPRTERKPWSEEEFLFVMRNAPDKIRRACLILINTGLRMDELFHLEKGDFDLRNGVVKIKSIEGATTKTYQSRVVPIPDVLIELVALIPGPRIMGTSRKAMEHKWYAFKEDHHFERNFHELRHTFVSRMLKSGVDKKTVMEWVGHKTSGITDRYTHLLPERIDDWREKVNRGVNLGSEFVSGESAIVQPLWAPNGHQDFEAKKIPSKFTTLKGKKIAGVGFEPTTSRL